MGNEQSALSGEGGTPTITYGFHVLRNVSDNEVLREIEPWYDFIVGINGRPIEEPDPNLFIQEVRNCAGSSVRLWIWSAKVGNRLTDILVPLPPGEVNLGLTLQWTPTNITENVWHILEIMDDSPAADAGLIAGDDYIVGTPEGIVRGDSALGELIEDFYEKPLRLYVYNAPHNITRELTITPRRGWGGEGLIGCVLGFGHLHKIPAPLSEPLQEPGEMLFDSSTLGPNPGPAPSRFAADPWQEEDGFTEAVFEGSGGFVTAASLAPPPPAAPAGAPPKAAKKKPRRAGFEMDDLFKEGEQKSKELDYVVGGGPSAAVGPPPKASIPPPPKRGGG